MLATTIRWRGGRRLLNGTGVRFNSAKATAAAAAPLADLGDVATVQLADLTAIGDAALSIPWYHIGSNAIQNLVDFVHTQTGLPWWASIAATTVGVRMMMAPLAVPQIRASARMAVMRPELVRRQDQFKLIREPTRDQVQQMQRETWALFREHDIHPFKSIKFAFLQMPVFLSFFVALRDLGTRFPDVATGGALWFTNLAAADPYFLLPILSSATFLLTMELSTEGVAFDPKMKRIFRGLGVVMVPLTCTFPQALFIYWITNSLYAIAQVRTLRSAWARRLFDIPDPNHPDAMKLLMQGGSSATAPLTPEIIPNRPFKLKKPLRAPTSSPAT